MIKGKWLIGFLVVSIVLFGLGGAVGMKMGWQAAEKRNKELELVRFLHNMKRATNILTAEKENKIIEEIASNSVISIIKINLDWPSYSEKHRKLAYEAAVKSIILLKNNGVLPLKNDLAKYYVTGPNATNIEVLLGNYYGVNDNLITVLEGLASRIAYGSQMQYRPGCLLDRDNINPIDWITGDAKNSDATIVVLGCIFF